MNTMTTTEQALWTRIQGFSLDDPESALTFSQRLARENGWTTNYTQEVIAEYRKFIFLACVSPVQVTPSDPVDQAWHLHLTYTYSYWQAFCQETLGQPIHHNPTKGGANEQDIFHNCYDETLRLYEEKFGEKPPADVWPDTSTRFSDTDFVRINSRHYWMIRKPGTTHRLSMLLLAVPPMAGLLFGAGVFIVLFIALFIALCVTLNTQETGTRSNYTTSGSGFIGIFGDSGDSSGSDCDGGGDCGGDGGSGCGSGCGGGCGGGCGS